MKRSIFLLIILLGCSCKSLPTIQSFDKPLDTEEQNACSSVFPEGQWQFIHSIEATMPHQKKAFLMGITNISSQSRKISVVMMTIEGLVLLDAGYDQELKITKGIPPFDSKEFAGGLIEDIKLIFFTPEGGIEQVGYLKERLHVCRFKSDKGCIVDVEFNQDSTWVIKKYDNYHRVTRLIRARSVPQKQSNNKTVIPQQLKLMAFGKNKYSLLLDLIEAKRLSD